MATMLGSLLVSLGLESAQFDRSLGRAKKSMASFGRGATQMGKTLSIGITAPLAIFGKTAFDAAIQSRESFAQVEQALSTMGGASGKTAEELKRTAEQLQTFSNFDDDEILQKVTANLLTFGNIAGDQFDRVQQAAVDLSERRGQDLQTSTVLLGKALNDPIAGISALSRVSVSFTEDQKKMIKAMADAGDIAGAQGLILDELEKKYGGAAKAARDAAPGGDQAQAWRELQEVIGERLVVAFEKLEKIVTPIINSFLSLDSGTQTTIIVIAALAAAIGPALIVIGAMASGLGALITIGPAVAAAFATIKVAALGLMANPVILAFAAVLAGIVLAWQNWDKIQPVIDAVAAAVTGWYNDNVKPIMDAVMDKLGFVVSFFRDYFAAQIENYIGLISSLLRGDFSGAWEFAKRIFQTAVSGMIAVANEFFPGLMQMGKDIIRGIVDGIKALPGAVWDALKSVIGFGVDKAREFLGINSPSLLFMEFGRNIAQGLAIGIENGRALVGDATEGLAATAESAAVAVSESFGKMADRTLQSLDRMTKAIKGGGFLDILGSVINLGLQLGGIGAFGKGVQGRINASVPGFANGTRFAPGGLAKVGERGPELVNLPRGSQVIPNRELSGMGGGSIAQIVPSPYFNVVVDGRIVQASPAIMQGGANVARSQMSRMQSRRVG